jgi:hypothetical protein
MIMITIMIMMATAARINVTWTPAAAGTDGTNE